MAKKKRKKRTKRNISIVGGLLTFGLATAILHRAIPSLTRLDFGAIPENIKNDLAGINTNIKIAAPIGVALIALKMVRKFAGQSNPRVGVSAKRNLALL